MSVIDVFLDKGILISPEVLDNGLLLAKLSGIDPKTVGNVAVIDKAFLDGLSDVHIIPKNNSLFKIVFSYTKKPKKISVADFVSYFNRRFEGLSYFIKQRPEFSRTVSINRLKTKQDREKVSLIGLVFEKTITKNNIIILTIEDPTGTINVMIRPDKKELYSAAKDIVLDELIGVEGTAAKDMIYANQIFFPEIPTLKELKKGPDEDYVVLLGDPHFGSKAFLAEEFQDFIAWINQQKGSEEQRQIAAAVKYMFIIGDLVEGVGVHPGQEKDLLIPDIQMQYSKFIEYLKKIPPHIQIFVCPGNHDIGRLSEPQQPIIHQFAEGLQKMPNVSLVSNPAIINIGAKNGFPGFDFLMYHGYSLIYYANNVARLREAGGQKRADLIMKFLLQKRHLAPTHTSNLYIPDTEEDPLIIKNIPDFFITGHIHRVSANNFRNITLIGCSCWTNITEDQEKRGLQPQPAKVPIINLKTREVKIMNFLKEKVVGANAPPVGFVDIKAGIQTDIKTDDKIERKAEEKTEGKTA